jgi:hypothetical protein
MKYLRTMIRISNIDESRGLVMKMEVLYGDKSAQIELTYKWR